MTEVKIDKNVPVPSRSKWPFAEMGIGDSFLVPGDLDARYQLSMAGNASRQFKPKRFVCRSTPEGVRIWRVA